MESIVQYSKNGGIGTLMFDQPKANAYELGFMMQLNDALDALNADEEVRVVLIRSALKRFFCAGADLKVFLNNTTEVNKEMVRSARLALSKMESSDKIFIAVMNGHTLGGGLEIALACDLRFAAKGEFLIGLPEVKLGLMPGNGGSQRLPRLVGASKAMELMLTGECIGPEEAHRIGLVNKLFSAEALVEGSLGYAKQLAAGAPLAMSALKRSVNQGMAMALQEGLELESDLVESLYDTEDAREGIKSLLEKRPPRYEGS